MPVPTLPALPSSFDARFPILLLPVRVQVKFVHDGANYELWVRIYPDQISISTHEGGLTLQEKADGQEYWLQAPQAAQNAPHDLAHWRALVARYGVPRAHWIVDQTTPTNLQDLPAAAPIFPSPTLAPNDERWTQAAKAQGLPERFTVLLYNQAATISDVAAGPVKQQLFTAPGRAYDTTTIGNPTTEFLQLIKAVSGAPITSQGDPVLTRPLAVGLAPLPVGQTPPSPDPDRIGGIDAGNNWTVDFAQAVSQGMAVRIALTQAEYEQGFKRLVVVGVRATDAAGGQLAVQQLLTEHYYTTGLQLVPQGTPTNNTPDAAAGYSSRERLDADAGFDLLQQERVINTQLPWAERSDGQFLVTALGMSAPGSPHLATAYDTSAALRMNRALWPATYGYFLEEWLRPLLSAEALAWTRSLFENYVLARGTLPVMRVGAQPYGILPTTRFSAWEVRGAAGPERAFAEQLQRILAQLDATWTERLNPQAGLYPATLALGNGAPGLGVPTAAPNADNLLTTLGLNATSTEFYQRYFIGPSLADALNAYAQATNAPGAPSIWPTAQRSIGRFEASDNPLYREFTRLLDPANALGLPVAAPAIFSQTFQSTYTKLADAFADEPSVRRNEGVLLDDQPLSETSPLTPLRGVTATYQSWNYVHWLARASFDEIRREDFRAIKNTSNQFVAPNSLLYCLLRQAVLLEYWAAAKTHLGTGLPPAALVEQELFNVTAATDKTRWSWLYEAPSGQPPLYQRLRNTDSALATYLSGLEALADLPTAQLERLLAEHLDLGNYRLDAWRLAPVVQRLAELRQAAPTAQGAFLGAFGWLENLQPTDHSVAGADGVRTDADNLGYVHAPSLTHGTAAAILRQGYKSRQLTADNDDALANRMAVDLSSQRTRGALALMRGLQGGQALGALLGRAFERALQQEDGIGGQSYSRYIGNFRAVFPLTEQYALTNGQTAPQGTPAEQAARQVTDGAALLRAAGRGYPYGVVGLPASTTVAATFLQSQVKLLLDQLDALGDLTVSEGIYQAARGNTDRAAAVLESVAKGQYAVSPEVVDIPQRSLTFTQRVLVQLPADTTVGAWPNADTPRAAAAPRLNAWVAQFFPNPQSIRFALGYQVGGEWQIQREATLLDAGLHPVDLLYLLDDKALQAGSVLDQLLLYSFNLNSLVSGPGINYGGAGAQALRRLLPLLARLRQLLGSARPALPYDLQAPSRLADPDEYAGVDINGLASRMSGSSQMLQTIINDLADARTTPEALRAASYQAALFGLPEAMAVFAAETDAAGAVAALYQAAQARFTDAQSAGYASVKKALAAAASLFGPAFRPDVEFSLATAARAEYAAAASPAAAAALLAAHRQYTLQHQEQPLTMQEWLHGVGAVREPLSQLDRVFLIQGLLSPGGPAELPLHPAQLVPPNATGPHYWLGSTWPASYSPPAGVLSLVQWLPDGYDSNASKQSALWLDEWVETLPEASQTTALTFHYDQPNSEAPQNMLLVVNPRAATTTSWVIDDLVGAINETLDLAKKRIVEPDSLAFTHLSTLLPAVAAPVSRQNVTFNLDFGRLNGSARFGG